MTPKVSIIMPVKNVAEYIEDCIHSIRSQSFTDWELIIVNDHSTDATQSLLDSFALADKRIQVHSNQGIGIIPALQLAFSLAKGAFITRFDGDDIMPDNRLALIVKALASSTEKTIVTGKVKYFSDQPISKGYQAYEAWLNERIDQKDHWQWAYRECVIASPNWIMRRNELSAIGGFNDLTYPEDYDLVLRWNQHGFTVLGLDQITLYWREHPARTSRNSDHYNQEHFFRLKVQHFVRHKLGDSALVLWGTDTKAKLTASILTKLGTDFTWMGLVEEDNSKEIFNHPVSSYKAIENFQRPKLLIAVYPPENQRVLLENYLRSLDLLMGKHYWYL